MPNGYSSLLSRLGSRGRTGQAVGRARVRGQAYSDLDALRAGEEEFEERTEDLDAREMRRAKRMGRYGDVGRLIGGGLGLLFGGPVGAAALYSAGGRAGAEIGERSAIVPGRMLQGKSPIEGRAPAGRVPKFDEPVKFHQSKKAQLNKKISDMNRFIKRTQMQTNQSQWSNMFSDFLSHLQSSFIINPEMRESYWLWKEGKGDFWDIFKDYEDYKAPGSGIVDKFFKKPTGGYPIWEGRGIG